MVARSPLQQRADVRLRGAVAIARLDLAPAWIPPQASVPPRAGPTLARNAGPGPFIQYMPLSSDRVAVLLLVALVLLSPLLYDASIWLGG
jgi:hypothetical protein